MRNVREMLASHADDAWGDRPAHPQLFCALDDGVGHYRRYSRGELGSLLTAAGFSIERLFPFNLWGLFGWWLNGPLLRRKRLPGGQLSVFSRVSGLLIWLERRLRLPLGLSYIAVARPVAAQQQDIDLVAPPSRSHVTVESA